MLHHLNKDIFKIINNFTDPRNPAYITYSLEVMILVRILAYCSHIQSMSEMNDDFNHENVIKNVSDICGCELDNLPHGDTINLLFKRFDIQNLRNLMITLVKRMIESRALERYRLFNEYYQLIIDGTQLYCFFQEHIEKCLKKHHKDGTTTFHTQALVAYLMVGNNLMIPVDFEMLDNELDNAGKQDCERNAAKRLLPRIHKNFPRLKILLSADALYANQVIIEMCQDFHWRYIIRFKEGCAETLMEKYEEHKKGGYAKIQESETVKNKEAILKRTYTYVNNLEYQSHKVNIAEIKEIKGENIISFIYITDLKIDDKNVKQIIAFGRKRWKIENKGFNDEKNHGYGMSHAYSYHENAVKCHYALLLISHLIMQLLEHYMEAQGNSKKIKQLGKEIKEALRFAHLNANDYVEILQPIQFRQEVPY